MSTPFRRRVELQAGPLVVLMAKLPRVVPFLVVLGLLVAGLLIGGGTGAILLWAARAAPGAAGLPRLARAPAAGPAHPLLVVADRRRPGGLARPVELPRGRYGSV